MVELKLKINKEKIGIKGLEEEDLREYKKIEGDGIIDLLDAVLDDYENKRNGLYSEDNDIQLFSAETGNLMAEAMENDDEIIVSVWELKQRWSKQKSEEKED